MKNATVKRVIGPVVDIHYPELKKHIMSGKKLGEDQLRKLKKLITEYTESFAA